MNTHELIADLAQKIVTPSFHYKDSDCWHATGHDIQFTCKEIEEKFLKACQDVKEILTKHGIKENN